jgi:hypothetical protein
MSVIQSQVSNIPIEEYISGKAIFDKLKYFKCNQLKDYQNLALPPDNHPICVYCHTDFVNNVLINLRTYTNSFILISHNSDGKITYNPKSNSDANINLMPSNLLYWFGQNLVDNHSQIYSLPVGLENSYWSSENKHGQIFNKSKEVQKIKNLCYLNVNIDTNLQERAGLYIKLSNKNWTTKQNGRNGNNFAVYIDNIKNHSFVLCPEGNQNGHSGGVCAMGSHRVWETLYVGSIPVVKKSIASSYFYDLPILFIDSWEEITQDFLESSLIRIKNSQYNIQKMFLSYWINLIDSCYEVLED